MESIYLYLLCLGLFAGILSGLFGIGGGIVIVPILVTFFGFHLIEASATSLTALLLPVGIFGVISYYKAGLINVRVALWITTGLLVGSLFGALIALQVSEFWLNILYILFISYIACSFLGIKIFKNSKEKKYLEPKIFYLILLGIGAGILASLFGKGGGIIIVPLCIALFGFDTKMAVATSLAALQLPVGLPGVMLYANQGYIHYTYAILIALGLLLGTYFGTKMALKLPVELFRKVYAFFLFGVIAMLLYKSIINL